MAQDYGNRSADICLVMPAVEQAGRAFSLYVYTKIPMVLLGSRSLNWPVGCWIASTGSRCVPATGCRRGTENSGCSFLGSWSWPQRLALREWRTRPCGWWGTADSGRWGSWRSPWTCRPTCCTSPLLPRSAKLQHLIEKLDEQNQTNKILYKQ